MDRFVNDIGICCGIGDTQKMRLYKTTLLAIFVVSFFFVGQIARAVAAFLHPIVKTILNFNLNPKSSFTLIAIIILLLGYTLVAIIVKLISLVEFKDKKN